MFSSLLLAAPLFLSLNGKALPPPATDYYFVALGDNRPAGAGIPPTTSFQSLLKEVAAIGPAFVLSSGDLLYGNEETLAQYKIEESQVQPLLNALPCPFYNSPGNHELFGKPEFFGEYTSRWGATYGSFDYGNLRFAAVCTELGPDRASVFGDQLTWLKGLLADRKPTVVFQHHPVFARSTNPDPKEEAVVADAAAIHKLYVDGNVKMVLEGHDHIYDRQDHDGLPYIIAGGAGAPLDGPTTVGGYFHFLLVHVSNGTLEATPIPLGTLDIQPISDGILAVANYADEDLPLRNVVAEASFEPKTASGLYSTKKGKPKDVAVRILDVTKKGNGYSVRLALDAPKHRATFITLGR